MHSDVARTAAREPARWGPLALAAVVFAVSGCGSLAGSRAPSSEVPRAASLCTSSQLRLVMTTEEPWNAEVLWVLGFQNTGTSACSVQGGDPHFTVLEQSGQQAPVTPDYVDQLQGVWPPMSIVTTALQPGDIAGFFVVSVHNPAYVCDGTPTTLEATPPGSDQALTFGSSGFIVCSGDEVWVSPVHAGDAPPTPPS